MSWNILTGKLPETVLVKGTEYPIRWGFRTSILFEIMMRDKSISEEIKLERMLSMYYPSIPSDSEAAINAALWFYNHRMREQEKEEKGRGRTGRKKGPSYSFAQDGDYIYASFMEQYRMDLNRIGDEELHWWEFIALFEALNENTQMGKIIYYRSVSTSGMSSEKRRHINEMKKFYALKDNVGCDMKVELARRNARWKDYVKKRVSGSG